MAGHACMPVVRTYKPQGCWAGGEWGRHWRRSTHTWFVCALGLVEVMRRSRSRMHACCVAYKSAGVLGQWRMGQTLEA